MVKFYIKLGIFLKLDIVTNSFEDSVIACYEQKNLDNLFVQPTSSKRNSPNGIKVKYSVNCANMKLWFWERSLSYWFLLNIFLSICVWICFNWKHKRHFHVILNCMKTNPNITVNIIPMAFKMSRIHVQFAWKSVCN